MSCPPTAGALVLRFSPHQLHTSPHVPPARSEYAPHVPWGPRIHNRLLLGWRCHRPDGTRLAACGPAAVLPLVEVALGPITGERDTSYQDHTSQIRVVFRIKTACRRSDATRRRGAVRSARVGLRPLSVSFRVIGSPRAATAAARRAHPVSPSLVRICCCCCRRRHSHRCWRRRGRRRPAV